MGDLNKYAGVREVTLQERLKIGFNNLKERWESAPIKLTESTLTICGHPVMESWEENYMELLAEIATLNKGVILEVGFGMGISAFYIQKNQIDKHIIIEANKEICKIVKKFAQTAKTRVELIEGFWENEIFKLKSESIDGILFDTYPLSPSEVHKNHYNFFREAYRLLKPGGIFTYYSDEIKVFSNEHICTLNKAGFRKIIGKICEVDPPLDCKYWKSKTILAPIIIK
jgi:guanidinoacetate N-methyltransferase